MTCRASLAHIRLSSERRSFAHLTGPMSTGGISVADWLILQI